ncbi:MAG: SOS response-associated peptidase [Nitrospirae bacterium]|nr:MAG: SOS response-associated peptidase [Nitrospirota bacterium]
MCGRFTLTVQPAQLIERLGAHMQEKWGEPWQPRYNIAPSQLVACVRLNPHSTQREGVMLRWGLIPAWAKDPAIGTKLINARMETAGEKPAFSAALQRQRCLVLADGFYEWQRHGRFSQPYYIRLREGRLFAFAGLWDQWRGPEGTVIESCAILTAPSNSFLASIHSRMPLILCPDDWDVWLDGKEHNTSRLLRSLRPCPPEDFVVVPVSRCVNDPAVDHPGCIEPVE